MGKKVFAKNDGGFVCKNCGLEVMPLGYSSRNHCPRCLCSLHLDINPGDRESDCGGIMDAVFVDTDAKRGFIITHKCRLCGAVRRCRAANEAKVQPDDINLLIKLTTAK